MGAGIGNLIIVSLSCVQNSWTFLGLPKIKDGLKIYSCSRVEEVLRLALALDNPEGFLKVVPLKVVENEQSIEVAN